jgi:hypothetical protein
MEKPKTKLRSIEDMMKKGAAMQKKVVPIQKKTAEHEITLKEAKKALRNLEHYMYPAYKEWRAKACPDGHIIQDMFTLKAFIGTLK